MTYPKLWPVGGHPEGEAKVRQLKKLSPKWLRASGPGWVAEKQAKLSNVKYGGEGGMYSASALYYNDTSPKRFQFWFSPASTRGKMKYRDALEINIGTDFNTYTDSVAVFADGKGKVIAFDNTEEHGPLIRETRIGRKWKITEPLISPPSFGDAKYIDGALCVLGVYGATLFKSYPAEDWSAGYSYSHPLEGRTQKAYLRPLRYANFTPKTMVIWCSNGGLEGTDSRPKFYRTEDEGTTWSLVPNTDALFHPDDLNRYVSSPIDDYFVTETKIAQFVPVSLTKALVVTHGGLFYSNARTIITLFDFATGQVVKQENVYYKDGYGQTLRNENADIVALVGQGSWVYRKWRGGPDPFLRDDGTTDFAITPEYFLATDFWAKETPIAMPPADKPHFALGKAYGDPYGPLIEVFSAWYAKGAWMYVVADGFRRELWRASGELLENHKRIAVLSEPVVRDGVLDTNGITDVGWLFNGLSWYREFTSVRLIGAPNAPAPVSIGYPWADDSRFSAPAWWTES